MDQGQTNSYHSTRFSPPPSEISSPTYGDVLAWRYRSPLDTLSLQHQRPSVIGLGKDAAPTDDALPSSRFTSKLNDAIIEIRHDPPGGIPRRGRGVGFRSVADAPTTAAGGAAGLAGGRVPGEATETAAPPRRRRRRRRGRRRRRCRRRRPGPARRRRGEDRGVDRRPARRRPRRRLPHAVLDRRRLRMEARARDLRRHIPPPAAVGRGGGHGPVDGQGRRRRPPTRRRTVPVRDQGDRGRGGGGATPSIGCSTPVFPGWISGR